MKLVNLCGIVAGICCILVTACNKNQQAAVTRIQSVPMEQLITAEDPYFSESQIELVRNENLFIVDNGSIVPPDLLSFVPRAREIISTGSSRTMQVRKLGADYWALIEMPPSSLWPVVTNYLLEYESFAASDPVTGRMSTEWLEQTDGPSLRLVFDVSSGLVAGTSELTVQQFISDDPEPSTIGTLNESFDAKNYLSFLVDTLSEAPLLSSSLVAQDLDNRLKLSTIILPSGSPALQFKLNYDRSWSTIVLSLNKAGLDVIEQNKAEKWIKVKYTWQIQGNNWPKLNSKTDEFQQYPVIYSPISVAKYDKSRDLGVSEVERFIDFTNLGDETTQVIIRSLQGNSDQNQERLTSLILQNIR